MSKLFIGYVMSLLHHCQQQPYLLADKPHSGLAWHTDDGALRAKFEEFGTLEEAVRLILHSLGMSPDVSPADCGQGSRYRP